VTETMSEDTRLGKMHRVLQLYTMHGLFLPLPLEGIYVRTPPCLRYILLPPPLVSVFILHLETGEPLTNVVDFSEVLSDCIG
jgi:hypothetical protein